jgi:integrase
MARNKLDLEGFSQWLRGRLRREKTAEAYARNVKLCMRGRDPLARLRDEDLAPSTRRCQYSALKAYARYCGDDRLLGQLEDVRDMLPRPEPVEDRQPLEDGYYDRFCAALLEAYYLGPELHGACAMIAFRGFRVGDVCRMTQQNLRRALRTGSLDFRAKKGRQHSFGVLSTYSWCIEQLASSSGRWTTVGELLVGTDKGTVAKNAKNKIRRGLRKVARRAGVDPDEVYPHRLRHNYVLRYYRAAGNDLEATRQHVGHSDIATTARYIRKIDRARTDAIAEDMF